MSLLRVPNSFDSFGVLDRRPNMARRPLFFGVASTMVSDLSHELSTGFTEDCGEGCVVGIRDLLVSE